MAESSKNIDLIDNEKIDLSPKEVYQLLSDNKNYVLIDIREEWEIGKDAIDEDYLIFIPFNKINQVEYTLPNDLKLIFVCNTGIMSKNLVQSMIRKGRNNVAYMIDGFMGWNLEKLPTKAYVYKEYSNAFFCQLNQRPRRYKDDKYDS